MDIPSATMPLLSTQVPLTMTFADKSITRCIWKATYSVKSLGLWLTTLKLVSFRFTVRNSVLQVITQYKSKPTWKSTPLLSPSSQTSRLRSRLLTCAKSHYQSVLLSKRVQKNMHTQSLALTSGLCLCLPTHHSAKWLTSAFLFLAVILTWIAQPTSWTLISIMVTPRLRLLKCKSTRQGHMSSLWERQWGV